MRTISITYVKEAFSYDPDTGELVWAVGRRRGKRAGNIRHGSWSVKVGGRQGMVMQATHLIWVIMTGAWPKAEVDHRDRNPLSNRWGNLREADRPQQLANQRAKHHNAVGLKWVRRLPSGAYASEIRVEGRKRFVGTFTTPDAAHEAAYRIAVAQHGEYACAG